MPFLLLLLLFIVVPIIELAVIIQVGQAIGVLPTIALLLLDSVLGTVLMRAQGRVAWRRFNEAIASGRVPARETLDGALVILGGAFLLTPGFVTDIIGIVLLVPPTRALVRRVLVRGAARRFMIRVARPGSAVPGRRPPGDDDVEGSAREVDKGELPWR